jgi:large subunit ribosomal protein L18
LETKLQTLGKSKAKARRRHRIRKKVSGTAERPRLAVYRGLRNIEAQIIDDASGRSLTGLSTRSARLRETKFESRVAQGREVGKMLAAKAREQGIDKVVFDRGGRLYHGVVKAVADGAREGGLKV